MTRTKDQNIRFHALLNELHFDRDEKAAIVIAYSKGRTSSSKDLTVKEMDEVIKHLEETKDGSIRKMRSKIINIGKDLGLMKGNEFNFPALNEFLKKKFKKSLHELTREELPKAVTAMEAWRTSNMKKELGI